MAQVSEWLKLMVAEINRKREDAERAREEENKRQAEGGGGSARPAPEKMYPGSTAI